MYLNYYYYITNHKTQS